MESIKEAGQTPKNSELTADELADALMSEAPDCYLSSFSYCAIHKADVRAKGKCDRTTALNNAWAYFDHVFQVECAKLREAVSTHENAIDYVQARAAEWEYKDAMRMALKHLNNTRRSLEAIIVDLQF